MSAFLRSQGGEAISVQENPGRHQEVRLPPAENHLAFEVLVGLDQLAGQNGGRLLPVILTHDTLARRAHEMVAVLVGVPTTGLESAHSIRKMKQVELPSNAPGPILLGGDPVRLCDLLDRATEWLAQLAVPVALDDPLAGARSRLRAKLHTLCVQGRRLVASWGTEDMDCATCLELAAGELGWRLIDHDFLDEEDDQ